MCFNVVFVIALSVVNYLNAKFSRFIMLLTEILT